MDSETRNALVRAANLCAKAQDLLEQAAGALEEFDLPDLESEAENLAEGVGDFSNVLEAKLEDDSGDDDPENIMREL